MIPLIGKGALGFNALTEKYEDLIKAGVIDPMKVVRCALQNAASVSIPSAHHRGNGSRCTPEERACHASGQYDVKKPKSL